MDQYQCSTPWWGLFAFRARINLKRSYPQQNPTMTGTLSQSFDHGCEGTFVSTTHVEGIRVIVVILDER